MLVLLITDLKPSMSEYTNSRSWLLWQEVSEVYKDPRAWGIWQVWRYCRYYLLRGVRGHHWDWLWWRIVPCFIACLWLSSSNSWLCVPCVPWQSQHCVSQGTHHRAPHRVQEGDRVWAQETVWGDHHQALSPIPLWITATQGLPEISLKVFLPWLLVVVYIKNNLM